MMKKELMFGILALLVMALVVIPASAMNPGTNGQPSQSCQAFYGDSGPFLPPGFNTGGFSNAALVYAGSGHSLISGNGKAVSQYDVACFQQFNKP